MVVEKNIGNKANNLILLKSKFNVPNFFCISSDEIMILLNSIGIMQEDIIEAFKNKTKRYNLRKKILNSNLNCDFDELKELNKQIIIRSAAIGEDGAKYSFAGIYESEKTINSKRKIEETLKKLISAAYSERVWHYCVQIGFLNFPNLSFMFQNYVKSEYAGVVFSETIYEGKRGLLINMVRGSTENAVLGKNITNIFLTENMKYDKKIPKKILVDLISASKKIQHFFGHPQDIEWCYANNKLYILQSRNITKHVHEELNVWDNSNIAESYSGVVLPLTCSFAKTIYLQVYKDLARTSNISSKKINDYEDVFENLLGFIQGRFYYNMLNWYKMLTLFPGYNRNKKNLDIMISAKSKADLEEEHKKNVTFLDKLRYYPYVFYRFFIFERDIKSFKFFVRTYLQKVKKVDFDKESLESLWGWFEDFKEKLLKKWSITVDNDFLAMTWFGVFNNYAQKLNLNNQEIIYQISDIKSIISAKQVDSLKELSEAFYKNKKAVEYAHKHKWTLCYNELLKDSHLNSLLDTYLNTYGGRFANELKLEAKDLESDPEYLPKILYIYEAITINDSVQHTNLSLPFHKKKLLDFFSSKAKHYLRHREELRLLRSQAFSHTRKLFVAIGKKLKNKEMIESYKDIFYLELEEIFKAIKNQDIELKQIILKRKKKYLKYKQVELDNVIITRGQEIPKPLDVKLSKNIKTLKGVGCSSGIVSGKVTVLKEFKLSDKKLEIVVVKHTDPGWTPIFGLCKGLIVENGGLLSHAAIISRELNLPCIIGVENATKLLKNNQNIILDANTGVIKIK